MATTNPLDALSPAAIAAANADPALSTLPPTTPSTTTTTVDAPSKPSWFNSFVSKLPIVRSLPALDLPNPGRYEDNNRESRDILSPHEFFDGAKLEVTRQLSEAFQIGHSISMGGSDNRGGGSYAFSTNIVNKKFVVSARFDGDGKLITRYYSQLLPNLTFNTQAFVSTEQQQPSQQPTSGIHAELEYRGPSYVGTFKLEKLSVVEASFMQSISRHAAFGFGFLHISAQGFTGFQWGARFQGKPMTKDNIAVEPGQPPIKVPRWVAAAAMSPFQPFSASFVWNTKTPVTLATDFNIVQKMDESEQMSLTSVWSAGALWEFRTSLIKARVDSNAHVGAIVEEAIGPATKITLSADLDHYNQKYKFGVGCTFNL